MVCIFCHRDDSSKEPWCAGSPGKGCTYGFHHEYPEPLQVVAEKQAPTVKVDRKICLKCGMHPKNPKAIALNCEHEFPT